MALLVQKKGMFYCEGIQKTTGAIAPSIMIHQAPVFGYVRKPFKKG